MYRGESVDRPAVLLAHRIPRDDPTYDRLKALLRDHSEQKAGWGSSHLETPYPATVEVEPHSQDWDRRLTTSPHTRPAILTASYLVSRHGLPGLHERYFIDSPAEAEAWLSLPLPELSGEVDGFFQGDARDR